MDAYDYPDESESLERLNNSKVTDNTSSTALMMVETKDNNLTLALPDEPPVFLFRSSSANLLVCTYFGKDHKLNMIYIYLGCFRLTKFHIALILRKKVLKVKEPVTCIIN